MSTQQDIYAAGSESRPPMLNKENYVPWSSRLLFYAKSRPNEKLIYNSILNGPYVRKMIPEPGDANRDITVTETFHLQTDDELSDKELKQIEADDQAIQTILLGLLEDIYAAVDSCETAQEIWLRPEWSRHVTVVHQTKDLHTANYTQLYDFLKYNQKEVDELKAERLAKTQDPLALMANSNNPYMVGGNGENQFKQYARQNAGNPAGYNDVIRNQIRCYNYRGVGHYARNCTVGPRRRDAAYLQTQLLIAQKEKVGIQLQAEEYDLMAAAADLDEIEEVNANCILMANLQQASTSGTQTDSAPVYDTDGSAEVHENCDDNEIFNKFTQEEQYTKLLEPIPESHKVPRNDNDIISEDTSVEQGRETVEQHRVNFEETRALYESLYQNLATKVEKVNSINRKLKETNTDMTTELAIYKNQERCFEISQEKYNKLERQIAQPGMNMGQDRQMQMIGSNGGNWFRKVQNVGNQNGLIGVQENGNQNQIGNGNLVATRAKGNVAGQNGNQIRCYNCRGVGHYARNCTEIWLRVQQMMKGSDIGIQEKKAKLFNEWEREDCQQSKVFEQFAARIESTYELKSERLAKIQDPFALMVNSNNLYASPAPYQDQSPFNQNYLQQPMTNPEDITEPTTVMNMALALMAKAFKLNYLTPTNNNQRISSNPRNRQYAGQNAGNLNGYNVVQNVESQVSQNPRVQNDRIQNQIGNEEYDLIAAAADLDEIEEVNVNCILMANLQQASSSGTQTDSTPVYDTDESAEVIQICLWCVDSGCSKHMTRNLKLLINLVWNFMGTVCFGNDHVAAILGFGDLQWGNILITRVYFIERLGHNLFSVGQFCDSDLEVAFRRNACFVKNLEGVDLLKGDRSTNLYTINLHEMASSSPICLMARASSTKSLLWHQRLSHLNFDTINDLARNNLVAGLPKFKYDKEHLCPSCEQGKSKRASHPPKPVPNSRQRLHLLHTDLCRPIRIASINGKRYVLVIVDDYSRNTRVYFLRSKDKAPEVIIKFLKRITVLLQSHVIIIRTDNDTEFKNQVLKEYFDTIGGMFRINPFKTSKDEKHVPNTVRASDKKKPITVSQQPVITKKDVNSDINGLSSTGVDNTKTRRPQPTCNTKNDRVPSGSKSSRSKNKEAKVEEHHRNLLLSKNNKHISSACNNIKIDSHDVISKVVCVMCKQCLISVNHDVCLRNYVNGKGLYQRQPKEISTKGYETKEDVQAPEEINCAYQADEPDS
nr:retrovirus-related Pol polyprotein from transposon TNT 1-94 [Tanacetum cinerariifolium]